VNLMGAGAGGGHPAGLFQLGRVFGLLLGIYWVELGVLIDERLVE
jgi:hypothetical protein